MNCPQCGAETRDDMRFCGECGSLIDPDQKILCDGCMGAFPAKNLKTVEGKRLCPLCSGREERRREGAPSPGHARMTQEAGQFRGHAVYRPEERTSVLAVVSLVAGLLCGLPGLVLGIVALLRIRSRADLGGAGFAVGGIVLGSLSLAAGLCMTALMIPAIVSGVREDGKAMEAQVVLSRILAAQKEFQARYGTYGDFDQLIAEGSLDPNILFNDDFAFDVEPREDGVRIRATPRKQPGSRNHYMMDEKGAFRVEWGKPATDASPVWRRSATPVRSTPVRRSSG